MHHYWQGPIHSQAHKGISEGHYEEEQGRKGFYGPVSHLVKKSPSTRWKNITGPLKPRMYHLSKLSSGDTLQKLLFNSALRISYWKTNKTSLTNLKARRNADSDVIYFCHQGSGEVLTEYGLLSFQEGCYIVIPKNATHSMIMKNSAEFLVIESRCGYFCPPERGMLGQHAVYDIQVLQKPNLLLQQKLQKKLQLNVCEIEVQRQDEKTVFSYEQDIYDVVGWKGNLFPFVLDIGDIMPVMSHRAHLPPSVHTTFLTNQFVVCSFVPRPLERDVDSLKVPFYHQNIDYDEVLFYHKGDFFSRDHLEIGMMSFHPSGFPHGPHPKAFRSVKDKTDTNEYAVMVDSALPLQAANRLSSVELVDYWKSWQE